MATNPTTNLPLPLWKATLYRFLRVLGYGALAAGIQFALAHVPELATGKWALIVQYAWLPLSALLVAADKNIRAKLEENK